MFREVFYSLQAIVIVIRCIIMMDMKTARRNPFVFERIGCGAEGYINNKVCKYWVAGRCNRNPCRFLHQEPQPKQNQKGGNPNPNPKKTWKNPNYVNISNQAGAVSSDCKRNDAVNSKSKECEVTRKEILIERSESIVEKIPKALPMLCQYWVTGDCVHGDNCKDLHSWFCGSRFSLLAKLEGHKKVITFSFLNSLWFWLFSSLLSFYE